MNWTPFLLLLLAALVVALVVLRASSSLLRRWVPIAELLSVVVAVGLTLALIAGDGTGPGLGVAALALVVIFFSREPIRDYLAGVRIRTGGRLRVGDSLAVDTVEGVVSHVGRFNLTLDDERGSVVVPHAKVVQSVLRQRAQRTGARPHRFEVEWEGEFGQPRAARTIRHAALLDPLSAAGREVHIEPLGPRKVAVTIHALASTHAYAIEAAVREALAQATRPS